MLALAWGAEGWWQCFGLGGQRMGLISLRGGEQSDKSEAPTPLMMLMSASCVLMGLHAWGIASWLLSSLDVPQNALQVSEVNYCACGGPFAPPAPSHPYSLTCEQVCNQCPVQIATTHTKLIVLSTSFCNPQSSPY